MKTLRNILLLVATMLVITSCEREFDVPPINEPRYDGEANTTIKELVDKYRGKELIQITDAIIIRGRVTANDISGNIYKQIQLQDETGGITIAIDRNNIYNNLRVGQEIFIECQGLFYGEYRGNPQLGNAYSRDNDTNFAIGQMAWERFQASAHLNGFPKPDLITSDTITIEQLNDSYIGKLVTVKNVSFQEGGREPFAFPSSSGGVQTQSKTLVSAASASFSLIARNSSAANFASFIMPAGVGSVTGVISTFSGTRQITFRDSLDCSPRRFSTGQGNGTQDMPWIIEYALNNQTSSLSGWIQGYIVGTAAPGIDASNPIRKNEDIIFSGDFIMNNTIVLAASAQVRDWTQCIVINLPEGTAIRSAINLRDNPANWGKLLKVRGTLQQTLGAAGLATNGTAADFEFSTASGGSIFLETCGNQGVNSGTVAPADYPDWDNRATATYAGNSVVRRTGALDTHVWFAASTGANPDRTLVISGINTANATDLKLSFDLAHNAESGTITANIMTVFVKDLNTNIETQLTVPTTGIERNIYSNVSDITGIPATSDLQITFKTTTTNTAGFRLDNIRIDGTNP